MEKRNYTAEELDTSSGLNLTEATIISWYRHSPGIASVFCVLYFLVFMLGIAGNSMIIAVVMRSPRMKTIPNLFIVNLACADLLVILFCLPATLLGNIFVPWILGLFLCKSLSYLQGVSVCASIYTLVAISFDRFVAICCPLRCQMTTHAARWIISTIWTCSLALMLPWLLFFELTPLDPENPNGEQVCYEKWPHQDSSIVFFFVANVGMGYALPLFVIFIFNLAILLKVWRRNIPGETQGTSADALMQRSKLKVVKMMVFVVAHFALSWLPLYTIFTMVKLGITIEQDTWKEKTFAVMVPIAQWLGASNSCINPILYLLCNEKYREGFLAILKNRSCCGTLLDETAHTSTKNKVFSSYNARCDTQV